MVASSISETAAVITGSRGSGWRVIICKLGHRVGKVSIMEATIALEGVGLNPTRIEVVLGESDKGTNGMSGSPILQKQRDFRFGKKGSLMFRSRMAERSSTDSVLGLYLGCLISRILRVYFWKRTHSAVVGSLLWKVFRTESLRKGVGSIYMHSRNASLYPKHLSENARVMSLTKPALPITRPTPGPQYFCNSTPRKRRSPFLQT